MKEIVISHCDAVKDHLLTSCGSGIETLRTRLLPLLGATGLLAFLKPFEGFLITDFENYSPEKWSSNLHNLGRLQVKEKLAALGKQLIEIVAELNLGLEYETSPERPSIWNNRCVKAQWLFFSRNRTTQRELQTILDRERSIAENVDDPAHHHRHMVLAVRVDQQGCVVMCGAHRSAWLDRRNIQQKWAIDYERDKLLSLFQASPTDYRFISDDIQTELPSSNEDTLDPVFSQATKIDGWISFERQFSVDAVASSAGDFVSTVGGCFAPLADIYRCLAWSKENDHISLAQLVAQEKKDRRHSRNVPFEENDVVMIVGGLFSGQKGIVQGFHRSGKVKVKVGTLALAVHAGSLKRMRNG